MKYKTKIDKNNIYVFVLLILCLFMTATLVLMLVNNANNQEFKERILILFDETKNCTNTTKVQYTFFQLK